MLIRITSDLHSEFWGNKNPHRILNTIVPEMPEDNETVLVVAGDLGLSKYDLWIQILGMLSSRFKAVIFVFGNHFYYNNNVFDEEFEIEDDLVYLLEDSHVTIDGVNFVGATLWTDFNNKNSLDMYMAQQHMNDYHIIKNLDNTVLTPEQTYNRFKISKKYIFDFLKAHKDEKNIVVTHHGCSYKSIDQGYVNDVLNYAYITDLSEEILDTKPLLWIHGHIHASSDYMIGDTRVICNPYGYLGYKPNKHYNAILGVYI